MTAPVNNSWQCFAVGPGNGLVSSRRQAITWTNTDLIHSMYTVWMTGGELWGYLLPVPFEVGRRFLKRKITSKCQECMAYLALSDKEMNFCTASTTSGSPEKQTLIHTNLILFTVWVWHSIRSKGSEKPHWAYELHELFWSITVCLQLVSFHDTEMPQVVEDHSQGTKGHPVSQSILYPLSADGLGTPGSTALVICHVITVTS